MAQEKPTEKAQLSFAQAARQSGSTPLTSADRDAKNYAHALSAITYTLHHMANGLGQMAVGMRATYVLLEEVKELLRRQSTQLPGRP